MIDNILFIIGIASIISIMWFNIHRFKNNQYNPELLRKRQGSELRIREFVAYIGFIVPVCFIQSFVLKSIYVLILTLSGTIIITILNLLSYKNSKIKKSIIETTIFDVVMLAFSIILVVFIIH